MSSRFGQGATTPVHFIEAMCIAHAPNPNSYGLAKPTYGARSGTRIHDPWSELHLAWLLPLLLQPVIVCPLTCYVFLYKYLSNSRVLPPVL